MAWLPVELVDEIFDGTNLFDIEENQETFMQLIGAADQLPFECIGQADESKLAFEMCHRKGLKGKAMDRYLEFDLNTEVEKALKRYLDIDSPLQHFPKQIWESMEPLLYAAKETTNSYTLEQCNE